MATSIQEHRPARAYALTLGALALAFLGRVLGQFSVAYLGADFLPPMEAWESGVLEYPALLTAQVLILALQAAITISLWTGRGRMAARRKAVGVGFAWLAAVYFFVMFSRWVVTVWLPIDLPWSRATIPIYFHWVLAFSLYLLSRYHRGLPLPVGLGERHEGG